MPPSNKTKLVCTLGPASGSRDVVMNMMRAGMDVARLNLAHGDPDSHRRLIDNVREAAGALGKHVAVMADLPGPKLRIGPLSRNPIELSAGLEVTLSTDAVTGDESRLPVDFLALPRAVRPGDMVFLNDGYVQLEVRRVRDTEVDCSVVIGGEIRSRQGLNLPGVDLGISAFTDNDRRCLEFALAQGVDAVSQSFVEAPADVTAVRAAAAALGHKPFIIAKIERAAVLQRVDEILAVADGIMIARGHLGVEVPIESLPAIQKQLTASANRAGKPVITATQMLESMTHNRRPTRAEVTDVANAVLDGTDCVMLSGESAVGRHPVAAVAMLASIAAAIEPLRSTRPGCAVASPITEGAVAEPRDLVAASVETALRHGAPAAVVVPTLSGATARSVARFRPSAWCVAVSPAAKTCRELQFSWGVHAVHASRPPADWAVFARAWLRDHGVQGDLVILVEGPSAEHPSANDRMEIIDLRRSR